VRTEVVSVGMLWAV